MKRRSTAIVAALCVGYAAYYAKVAPADPVLATDSAGYFGFAPIRTLGYPIFLALAGAKGASLIQPALFVVALAWLGIEIVRATSSDLLAAGVLAVSMATPQLTMLHATILTESLFTSGLVMFLAAATRFTRQPTGRHAGIASLIAGVIATIRPTGLALLAVLPVLIACEWRRMGVRRWTILSAALMPMIALVAAERIAARIVHGDELTSLTGRHLYAKAALLDTTQVSDTSDTSETATLKAHLRDDFASIRGFLTQAPPNLRPVMTTYYETCLEGPCVPELGVSLPWGGARINRLLLGAALDRIARAPFAFAALTATHYRSLWTADKLRHPGTVRELNAFVASHRPLPFEREAFALTPETRLEFQASPSVRFIQPVVIAMGWMTAACAVAGVLAAVRGWRRSADLSLACLAAVTAHATLLFSVLLAPGLARYIISVWPAVVLSTLAGCRAIIAAGIRAPDRSP